ncbi:MAG: hypothetical protein AAF960_27290 [Bacteroidota bacterium]
MDKLKKHIKKNRAELDRIESPDLSKIWRGVRTELSRDEKKKPSSRVISLREQPESSRRFTLWAVGIAASLALVIGIGVGSFLNPASTATSNDFDLAVYAPQIAEQAQQFQQQVNQKMTELNFESIDTVAFQQVLQELRELDGEYEHWAKDVPQYVQERELLEFLQRHYQRKIRILDLLAKEIEKKEFYEKREIRL